jgi:hypothetical protein
MITKKDLIMLADYIRAHNANAFTWDKFNDRHIDQLAHFCSMNNPSFKKSRWIDYINGKCGPNGGKRTWNTPSKSSRRTIG